MISIIIRCYNEEKFIGKLLSGIMAQDYDEFEIIIVDSGSTDATISIARRFPTKIISIKPEDFSFGYALNVGCKAATGDILLFASAHVYPVYKTWLTEIADTFKTNAKIACVYGRQIGHPSITKYSEHRIFAKWFPIESNFDQQHPFSNNANCAILKSLWKDQPYDETLTGLEDLDWAKKIMQKGYRIAYNANASIVHVHEETPEKILNRYRREAIAMKRIVPEEKFSLFDFFRLSISNIVSDYFHSLHDNVFFKNCYDIPMFRIMQFWGAYKGNKQVGSVNNTLRRRFYYPTELSRKKHDKVSSDKIIEYSSLEERYEI